MKRYVLILFALTLSQLAWSQDELPPISTDRPDQTESAVTVPVKTFQIESGFTFGWDENEGVKTKDLGYNGTLFRYGLLSRLEVRLGGGYGGLETTYESNDSTINTNGMLPMYLGLKWNILEGDGPIPTLAALTHVDIPPTAGKDFDIDGAVQNFLLAGSWQLSKVFSFGFNLGGLMNWKQSNWTTKYTASLSFGILKWMGGFVELYGFVPTGEYTRHSFDAGFVFPVRNNPQFDISGGMGISDSSTDGFGSVGFAWRIPR
jgi:hypothetical protein